MHRGWAGKLETFERHKAAALETLKEGIVVTGGRQRMFSKTGLFGMGIFIITGTTFMPNFGVVLAGLFFDCLNMTMHACSKLPQLLTTCSSFWVPCSNLLRLSLQSMEVRDSCNTSTTPSYSAQVQH